MRLVRQLLTFLVSGALAGVLLSTWMGPSVIEWDQRGAANANLPCLCAETTRRGADILIAYQMKGLLIGSALGLISGLAFVIWRQRVKKAAAATTPPAA